MSSLHAIAKQLVTKGKGILAADESLGTIGKRFDKIGIDNHQDHRRAYREMLFRAEAPMRDYISGVITFDETLKDTAKDGTPMVDLITSSGALAGIKVDMGAKALPLFEGETVTEGLDGLRERLAEYYKIGARFAKWRGVYYQDETNRPTRGCSLANAQALARYAALCQEAGIVPIVEPEVLCTEPGTQNIDRCFDVTSFVLQDVFAALADANVDLKGIILKPNMVTPGKFSTEDATPQQVAESTIEVFKNTVPEDVPGIAFLSGGQDDAKATEHLSLMNQMGSLPWALTFSFGRALQTDALKGWSGKDENIAAAQKAFNHRAYMNSLAALGKWHQEAEQAA